VGQKGKAEMSGTVFGPTVSARDVESHTLLTLQYWFETYLQDRELETGRARGSVARPKSWRIVNKLDTANLEDQTPFVAVISDGLSGPPVNSGTGSVMATWSVGVGIIASASTEDAAQLIVKDIYCPVVRKIMLQKQSLRDWTDPTADPFSNGVDWIHEAYDNVAFGNAERTLWSAVVLFEVTVDAVTFRRGGPLAPADPTTQPGTDWDLVLDGDIKFQDLNLDATLP
jgi:hypothetical protein